MTFDFNSSLLDAIGQGKVSTDSGLSSLVTPSQTSFQQVNTAEIKKHLKLYYSNDPRGGNAYDIGRKPWIFTTFEALDSLAGDLSISSNTSNTAIRTADSNSTFSVTKDLNQLQGPDVDSKRIFLAANPSSVSWNIPQRGVEAKNKSGTVHHYWYDSVRNTYFDDPKITINFQTGNIMPLPQTSDPYGSDPYTPRTASMSQSLLNFYQFLSLVDQQKITVKGEANLIHILYRSNIFPAMVLTGMFDPQVVVQFQDDSQNPWKITGWSANFTIFSTTPEINSYSKLTEMFRTEFANVVD